MRRAKVRARIQDFNARASAVKRTIIRRAGDLQTAPLAAAFSPARRNNGRACELALISPGEIKAPGAILGAPPNGRDLAPRRRGPAARYSAFTRVARARGAEFRARIVAIESFRRCFLSGRRPPLERIDELASAREQLGFTRPR